MHHLSKSPQDANDGFVEIERSYKTALEEWESRRAKGKLEFKDYLAKEFERAQVESTKSVDAFVEVKIEIPRRCGNVTCMIYSDGFQY